jgi:hypothetical protein
MKEIQKVLENSLKYKHCSMCKHYKIKNQQFDYGYCRKLDKQNPFQWEKYVQDEMMKTKVQFSYCKGSHFEPGGAVYEHYLRLKH